MLAVALTFAVAACASPGEKERVSYKCESGETFSVAFFDRHAVVSTATGSHHLPLRRHSALGDRYGAKAIAFMRDEDRAVLIDADGHLHRGCTELRDAAGGQDTAIGTPAPSSRRASHG